MKSKKINLVFIISVAIFMIIFITLLALLFNDVNRSKYNVEPSDKILSHIIISTFMGEKTVISQDELNSLIAYKIEKTNQNSNDKNSIDGIYFDFNDTNNTTKVYIPFTYGKLHLGFSANVKVKFESDYDRFAFEISNSKIGMIPISDEYIIGKIAKADKSSIITVCGNKIYMDSSITPCNSNDKIKIHIEDVEFVDGNIVIETKGVIDTIEEMIIQDWF